MISGPPARWTAPSTPPPPASDWLAAFTMASTGSVVMSACCSVIRPEPMVRSCASGAIDSAEAEAGVVAAKAERGAQCEVDASLATGVGNVVEVALRIGLFQVDRRRHELVMYVHNRDHRLNGAGGAEQVPVHRLRRRHRNGGGGLAEGGLHSARLRGIIELCRGAMGVDVPHLSSVLAGAMHRAHDTTPRPIAVGGRLRDVRRVSGRAVAGYLPVDARAPPARVLIFLEDDDARPLAHHEPVAVLVEGTRGPLRLIVACRQRLPGIERGDADVRDRRLGSPGDDHGGIAAADPFRGLADGG